MKKEKTIKVKTLFLAATMVFPSIEVLNAQARATYIGCFTRAAANNAGSSRNMRNNITAGRRNTNRAMEGSGTRSFLGSGGSAIFPSYNDANRDAGSALGDFRRRRGVIGRTGSNLTQAQLENRNNADLMMLVIRRDRTGGGNGQATPDTGYSCILQGRSRQPTFPHEIGHNYTGLHSHANTLAMAPSNNLPRNVTTLIGSRGQNFGAIINRYSTPNRRYRGARLGRAGSRENALRMSRNRNREANRR